MPSILVVDDDPNLLRMLRRGLTLAGYEVRAAEDGEAALRMLVDEEPDLLVLDVMLPEPLDGLELARRLRGGGSDVPIIMLTARDKVSDKVARLCQWRRRLPAQAVRLRRAAGARGRVAQATQQSAP
jgi:two-component system response regulator MprA